MKDKRPIVRFDTNIKNEEVEKSDPVDSAVNNEHISSNQIEPSPKRVRRDDNGSTGLSTSKGNAVEAPIEDVYAQGKFLPREEDTNQINHKFKKYPLPKEKIQRTNDEVHGSILYPPVIYTLANTPPFQRLRDLKQLGTSDHAYINCNHSRFEHSFGVYHLALMQCQQLRDKQPLLRNDRIHGLTEKDMLCVAIAGQLHDLGHGPYSHTYERSLEEIQDYIKEHPELEKQYEGYPDIPKDWAHEDMSLQLIDAILKNLGLAIDLENLDQPLKQINDGIDPLLMRVHDDSQTLTEKEAVLTSRDFVFIKEAIYGKPIPFVCDFFQTSYFVGRPWETKEYLYGIVSNAISGLDADKLDYLARDESRATGDRVKPQYRILEESYVAKTRCVDPKKCIRCNAATISNAAYSNIVACSPSVSPRNPCSSSRSNNTVNTWSSKEHYTICYPKKMAPSILDNVFLKRRYLHKMLYKHHTVECANLMICDIFSLADPYLRLPLYNDDDEPEKGTQSKSATKVAGISSNGKHENKISAKLTDLPLSRAMLDENAYLRMRDSDILAMISNSNDPRLLPARKLVNRFRGRDFYKMAAHRDMDCETNSCDRIIWKELSEHDIRSELTQVAANQFSRYCCPNTGEILHLEKDDILVKKTTMHCGRKDKNPLEMIRFLEESAERTARRAKTFQDLPTAKECEEVYYQDKVPKSFESKVIRVYVRNGKMREFVKHVFLQWYGNLQLEEDGDGMMPTTLSFLQQSPVQLTQDSFAPSGGADDDNWTPRGNNNHMRTPESTPNKRHFGDIFAKKL